jgi:hypothetical protein
MTLCSRGVRPRVRDRFPLQMATKAGKSAGKGERWKALALSLVPTPIDGEDDSKSTAAAAAPAGKRKQAQNASAQTPPARYMYFKRHVAKGTSETQVEGKVTLCRAWMEADASGCEAVLQQKGVI